MQINNDPLIEVIARAESEFYREPTRCAHFLPAHIAAAVRSFMGPETSIESATIAMWQQESLRAADRKRLIAWEDEAPDIRDKWHQLTRAALSAATGEDIGGGRG